MKIAQIGFYPVSADCIRGGVEASVYGLAHELSKQHEVVCFDFPRASLSNQISLDKNVRVFRYQNPGRMQKDMIRCLDLILNDIVNEAPDVCHVHGTGLLSKLLYSHLQQRGFRMMLTVHGLAYIEKKNQILRKFSLSNLYKLFYQSHAEFSLLRNAPHAIVDTDYVAEALHRYPCRLPALHTIPQGINSCYFKVKCSSESNVILSVGSIGIRKGHLFTVDAFDQLRARGVLAQLRIYGVLAEDTYANQLKMRVASSPYAADIELHFNAPLNDLMAAYKDAHLFALHSQEESQGIVFAEAMACGLPVVATDVGGIPFVVSDGQSGLLCHYSDSQAMADAMEKLMTDSPLWSQMSAVAIQQASRYEWAGIAESILSLYSECK